MSREWPGNQIDCTGENLEIHDLLCDILEEMGYSESDVNTASVGMWGALKIAEDRWKKPLAAAQAEARDEKIRADANWKLDVESSAKWKRALEEISELRKGLSKREHFAGLAMSGILARSWHPDMGHDPHMNRHEIADAAVEQADALISALNKVRP